MADDNLTAALEEIGADIEATVSVYNLDGIGKNSYPVSAAMSRHARPLLAALRAVLELADDLMRKSEALDAEAEYVAGEHPEAAAVAVLKRERSIAYDECARWFREAITREITGKGESDGA